MRLLCLYSMVEKGVPKKIYRNLVKEITDCYG